MCINKFLNIRSLLLCIMQVPGNLIVSARSASHSFDSSQMNMSHVISHFSFGKKITPRVMSDLKRLLPHLGGSHDRLNGLSYISNPSDSNANVTVSYSIFFTALFIFLPDLICVVYSACLAIAIPDTLTLNLILIINPDTSI